MEVFCLDFYIISPFSYFYKRRFEKWWSTILLISTKRTITSHLKPFNTKKTVTYGIRYPAPGLGQANMFWYSIFVYIHWSKARWALAITSCCMSLTFHILSSPLKLLWIFTITSNCSQIIIGYTNIWCCLMTSATLSMSLAAPMVLWLTYSSRVW